MGKKMLMKKVKAIVSWVSDKGSGSQFTFMQTMPSLTLCLSVLSDDNPCEQFWT